MLSRHLLLLNFTIYILRFYFDKTAPYFTNDLKGKGVWVGKGRIGRVEEWGREGGVYGEGKGSGEVEGGMAGRHVFSRLVYRGSK